MRRFGFICGLIYSLSAFGLAPEQRIFSWVVGQQNYRGPSQENNEAVVLALGREDGTGQSCIFRMEAREVEGRDRLKFVFASLYLPPERFFGAGMFFKAFEGGSALTVPLRVHSEQMANSAGTAIARDVVAADLLYGFSEVFLVRPSDYNRQMSRKPDNLTKDVRIEWITDETIGNVRQVQIFDLGSDTPNRSLVTCGIPVGS